jgi:hypothetical protein
MYYRKYSRQGFVEKKLRENCDGRAEKAVKSPFVADFHGVKAPSAVETHAARRNRRGLEKPCFCRNFAA